jgi:hypothetical protein
MRWRRSPGLRQQREAGRMVGLPRVMERLSGNVVGGNRFAHTVPTRAIWQKVGNSRSARIHW